MTLNCETKAKPVLRPRPECLEAEARPSLKLETKAKAEAKILALRP